jgi:hypothetical protein
MFLEEIKFNKISYLVYKFRIKKRLLPSQNRFNAAPRRTFCDAISLSASRNLGNRRKKTDARGIGFLLLFASG